MQGIRCLHKCWKSQKSDGKEADATLKKLLKCRNQKSELQAATDGLGSLQQEVCACPDMSAQNPPLSSAKVQARSPAAP